ncbi:SCO7613 C-terminal domain-containing membrane protein [Cytobacillus sp. FJAT-53684]|uniref:SCO7613 C-terminal domain-containing membrane protein n=1 Tax=Cytobacillus mangrovibacter TaxID=3299024 RepID=A0ABW6JT32_9BACI
MDSLSKEELKQIFRNELHLLKEKEYISAEQYEKTMIAYYRYHADLEAGKFEQPKQSEQMIEAVQIKTVDKPVPQVKKVEKKKLSAEEVREKNISWLLHLGVIFLLIGGLYVATSNWDVMSNWMKSGSIAFVSFLFYGIAYISKKILKIERTSFAFIVLGSLFLPIFILSIGWFELLGPYLSFTGEGRFILGAIGSFLLFPIYTVFANKLKSRLFVWFAYLFLTAGVGFLLASFKLDKDGFYFGMMLYNALLAASYHWLKNKDSLKLFTKELVYFAQINLILSTLLMLSFFNSHVFYSFNILLTAAVYLSMVFVSGRKEFHFVFSVMVVYGAYQLIEYSILEAFGPMLYVLVGAGFLAVPKVLDGNGQWEKVFRLTSAIVSSLAFIYISVEGILLRMNEPSIVLFLAYLIIAAQFTYLANMMKNRLFAYLSPVFLATALFEIVVMLDNALDFEHIMLLIFFIGFVLFMILGVAVKYTFVQIIVRSSRDVGLVIMLLSIVGSFLMFDWLIVGIMLLIFSFVNVITARVDDRSLYTIASPWAIPISLGFAFLFFGEEMRSAFLFYKDNLGVAMNYVLSSASLLLLSFFWKFKKHPLFSRNAFYIAQGFYTMAISTSILSPINDFWMRPMVLLAGIGMYLSFYFFTKFKWIPFPIAVVALFSYYAILNAIHSNDVNLEILKWIQLPLGAVLLLAISWYLLKRDPQLSKGFSWIGHVNLPFSLVFTLFLFWEKSIWGFLASVAAYWISSRICRKEWKIKLFLYSAFLALFMIVLTSFWELLPSGNSDFVFLVISGIIFVFWIFAKPADKQRTIYFFIPFSLIGILAFIASYPFGGTSFSAMVVYTAGLIIFLHLIRKDFLVGIPLLLLFIGAIWFLLLSGMATISKFIIIGGFGIGLALCGQLLYKNLLTINGRLRNMDSYSFIAFLFFATMYPFQTEALWTLLIPGLLISTVLFLQRKRIKSENAWIPILLSGLFFLEPYYALIGRINIPELIEVELNTLPFVAVTIFARSCLKGKFQKETGLLQWAVLTIVSFILIADGMASSTIYDALILGTLSLAAMLAGMFLRIKSYFFVGSGVLLLNVLLQTRPYWGNLPWWAYLLIAGSILIAVASYNEWHKQKTAKGEKTFISEWKKKIISKLKEWK